MSSTWLKHHANAQSKAKLFQWQYRFSIQTSLCYNVELAR